MAKPQPESFAIAIVRKSALQITVELTPTARYLLPVQTGLKIDSEVRVSGGP